ncbi:tape measure protein [Vibrio navarrensis]|uniref:tape measure protein n=1 Tax=Vibrio navarrensis TaxID=29495 RepID=UPI0023B027FC|nr:tape measure protein [Vibrio navarrensis]
MNAKNTLGQYQDMRTQITALVGGQEEWLQTEQYLNQVAEEHNKTVADLSGSYARLLTLQNGGLITQQQVTSIFEGMSNAASANGATNEQLSNTMYGLQQAMASGTVRAEEFNQVTESMPDLLIKLAESADTTVGGLRNMVNSGKMTSELFGELLVKALEKYDGAAARNVDNIRAQENAFSRAYQDMVLAFEKPISTVFSNSVSASTSVLRSFVDNAEQVTDLVGVAMFAALGRGTVAITSMTAAKARKTIETRQEIMAEQQKNVVELASIQSEIRRLEVMRATNAQRFAATGAANALAAAEAREKVLKDALTASQARLNVTMRAGTALMGALGGPAGVAMMAAGAISYFALTNSDAKTKTDSFSESIESLLGQMSKLEEQRLTKGLEERLKALRNVELQIETISRRKGTEDIQKRLVELAKLRTAEQTLKQEIVDIEDKIYEVRSRPSPENKNSPTSEQEEAAKAGERLLATLSRQAALYGQTSEVAKVRYEIEKGSLQGINDQLKEQLLLQAQTLDNKKVTKTEQKDTKALDEFYAQTDEMENAWLKRLALEAAMENRATIQEKYAYNARLKNLEELHQKAVDAAGGNKEKLAAIESEYRYQQQIAEADHQARLKEIEAEIFRQREESSKTYWERYLESAEKALGDFDNLAQTTINSFSSGMGNAFESMVFDAESFGDAMFKLAEGMARTVVNALGRMAAEWLAYHAVQMFVGNQARMQQVQHVVTDAQVSMYQAGLNAYTSTAAIPIYGPLAAPVAMEAAIATTAPMVGAITSLAYGGLAGQAHNGINRVPKENEGTWMLKAGEMVLNNDQADNFRWMVGAMRDMKAMFSSMTSSSAGSASSSREKPINVHVHGVDKERVRTSASESGGEINIEVVIDQAVNRSLQAVYNDFDNGGPISMRSKAN